MRKFRSISLLAVAALALASAVPASAQISPQKLDRLVAFIERAPAVSDLAEPIWRGLGLADNFNSKTASQTAGPVRHLVRVEVAAAKRLVFAQRGQNEPVLRIYLSDRRASLIAAGIYDLNTKIFTPVSPAAARAGFEAEMRFWEAEPLD
jgi:hypothetical protein